MLRPSLKFSIVAAFTETPTLPTLTGDALVFGSAPNPSLPDTCAPDTTIISVNASQAPLATLFGLHPDMTFMRSNFTSGRQEDAEMLSALAGRRTGTLVLVHTARLRTRQDALQEALTPSLDLLKDAGYTYDNLVMLDQAQRLLLLHRALERSPHLLKSRKVTSMGISAVAAAFLMGAGKVAISGVSLSEAGHAYSAAGLPRRHVPNDQTALRLLGARFGARLAATDATLCGLTGLDLCAGSPAAPA